MVPRSRLVDIYEHRVLRREHPSERTTRCARPYVALLGPWRLRVP